MKRDQLCLFVPGNDVRKRVFVAFFFFFFFPKSGFIPFVGSAFGESHTLVLLAKQLG